MKGYIHSIETFGTVDGPGVRYVVFTQGCPMRCKYCHNPDTWFSDKGQWTTSDELLAKAMRYKSYWKADGGITVSGGEPLLQIDFVIEFFKCPNNTFHKISVHCFVGVLRILFDSGIIHLIENLLRTACKLFVFCKTFNG